MRILSIQSHVVHGYVGNKCAVFPLQLLGYDVDILNTVQYSNHTGYDKGISGSVTPPEEIMKIVDKLEENDLLSSITHVLQGYCPNTGTLQSVKQLVLKLREKNKDIVYVCDPVMGDNGELYVSENLAEKYRNEVIGLAQFIVPNQFEAEQLAGTKINNQQDAANACNILHDKGVETVVITSLFYEENMIILMGSSRKPGNECTFILKTPALPHYYTGTGDLFASLLLGWHIRHPNDLKLVCEKAVAAIRRVIINTADYQKEKNATGINKYSELRVIQSRDAIENPTIEYFGDTFTT